jgi:hypothetical protein
MVGLRVRPGWLGILACLALCGGARAAEPAVPPGLSLLPSLDNLPEAYRRPMSLVLAKPVMRVRGPSETFRCEPMVYQWLLDHPDRAVKAWLRLGAKCVSITDRGNGRFGCKDGQGSDVHWDTVVSDGSKRVWYAEGVVKLGLLLPSVPVQAILVMNIEEGHNRTGQRAVRHQAELIVHTDSKAAALATRILGASAPHVAEQYVGQIEMFFSALAWYIGEHPDRTSELLSE